MSSIFKVSLVAVSLALVASCNTPEKEKEIVKPAATAGPTTELEKQSYGLGVSFGDYLKRALDENKKVDLELNTEMVLLGVQDAVKGDKKLTEEEVNTLMQALDTLARERHAELAKVEGAAAIKVGNDYLAINAKKEGVTTTESGLQYSVITKGEGAIPTATDKVSVHYRGTLIDGTEFDSSYTRNQPAVFQVGGVIPGWTEALQLMTVGSKYQLTIPSALAYGERATGKITANSTLLFEVELLEIVKPEEAPAK